MSLDDVKPITLHPSSQPLPWGSSIKDVRKRWEGVKGKRTRADMGEGGQARVEAHIW